MTYTDHQLGKQRWLRKFALSVADAELHWHRDREDRLITVIAGAGWQLQYENELPLLLKPQQIAVIPAGVWHRLHKGQTDLIVQIYADSKLYKLLQDFSHAIGEEGGLRRVERFIHWRRSQGNELSIEDLQAPFAKLKAAWHEWVNKHESKPNLLIPEIGKAYRYVIHEHYTLKAKRAHWDLRFLVPSGQVRSFAIPKARFPSAGEKLLAIEQPLHSVKSLEFSGDIPAGEYGAGTLTIMESGHLAVEYASEFKLILKLKNKRIRLSKSTLPGEDKWFFRLE